MPDFNQETLDPSRRPEHRKITDPKNIGAATLYPKHLYVACEADDEGAFVVAWHGKTPIYNAFIDVKDEIEEEDQLAAGYSLVPIVPERQKPAPKAGRPTPKPVKPSTQESGGGDAAEDQKPGKPAKAARTPKPAKATE